MAAPDARLLNDFQRDLPLLPRPFAAIAARLGCDEEAVLAALARLMAEGKVSRVGATFATGALGAATLAAMSVPPARLTQVADLINAHGEVNHNYEREHRWNLWFVVTGPDQARVDGVLREIEQQAQCGRVLSLPMVEPYCIDLGFDMSGRMAQRTAAPAKRAAPPQRPVTLSQRERGLAAALEHGLALVPRPYATLAVRAQMSELAVIETLARWLEARVINRLGVIVRHHELGFDANAMAVWDLPDAEAAALGRRVARSPCVTLCYRRARGLPDWRYNFYCMIHGRNRAEVTAQIAELAAESGLARYPSAVLFSRRRFLQRGARYLAAGAAHG